MRKIEKMLEKQDDIVYGVGNPVYITYRCEKKKYNTANILILLNIEKEIAIIWNLKWQRDRNHTIKTQSLSRCSWEDVLPNNDAIKDWYKRMGNNSNRLYEKVLAMNFH